MKPKTKPLFFLFFSVLILGMFFIPQNVNATSYYNWIQNPSFQTYINYVEDGSFESGSFDSGIVYGNWSSPSGFTIETNNPNSGIYNVVCDTNPKYLWYNLTSPYTEILGVDIVELSFYQNSDYTGLDYRIEIHYNDATSDNTGTIQSVNTYTYFDVSDYINNSKYVVAFCVYTENLAGFEIYFDDFVLSVDDGEGQDEIVFGGNNYWQLGQTSSSYAPYFGNINTVFGRIDNTSCQLDSPSETYKIIQYIDFLDSNSIHYINLYTYGADVGDGEGIKIKLLYSDGSVDEKTVLATGDGSSWEELNFGKSWIDSGKYITLIYIYPVFDSEAGSFNIDDVGIWCSIPYGYSKFQFTISPYPIEKGSYDFDAYSETTYTFTGYFYNVTDLSLSINGTYQIGDSFGLHSGDMTNGLFSLQLNKRTYTASPYTLETLSVTIVTDNEIFNVNIRAYWYPVSGGTGDTDSEGMASLMADLFMYGIFFVALPLTMSVKIGAMGSDRDSWINPSLGISAFVAMETIMGAITLAMGVIDLWFMIAILIVDAVLIFAMMKGRM